MERRSRSPCVNPEIRQSTVSSGTVGFHDEHLVTGPGIVVGRKGNVGSVYWCETDFWPIDTVYFVPPEDVDLFLYVALKSMRFISTDVAVPGLNRTYAHKKKISHSRRLPRTSDSWTSLNQ